MILPFYRIFELRFESHTSFDSPYEQGEFTLRARVDKSLARSLP
jgi:hypothetical protein